MALIVTTTDSVEGRDIWSYLDIVIGDHVVDVSRFRDPTSHDPQTSGENEVMAARRTALEELRERARELRADGVVSVVFNHQMVGQEGTLLLVSATGTAVRLKTPAQ